GEREHGRGGEGAGLMGGVPEQVQPRAAPVELRARPIEMDAGALAADLQRRGLYLFSEGGAGACFNNQFVRNADGTIRDLATGLAWEPGLSAQKVTKPEADAHVQALNRSRYLGHDDWRLPTSEEIVTLAESVQFYGPPSPLDPPSF